MEAERGASCVSVSEHSCPQPTSATGFSWRDAWRVPLPPHTHGKFSGFLEQRHKGREHHGNFAQPSSPRARQRCNICKWRRVQNLKDNMDDTGGWFSSFSW
ncbi:hypothetical protein fugu_009175 [Takifugu bimaculatus]|uniref:Uncharacterized protein n=1 Tax=Takifugu bimaculatus TaxID=433685 RepID=A0A4Z2AYI4_9TELE|nr:hypothetical protein fugu_009175 [Takifugu bimaculatus]